MADSEKSKQTVMHYGGEFEIENSHQHAIVGENDAPVSEEIDDEMLQQAFGEVSQPIEQNVQYKDADGENVTLIADGSVLTDVSGNVVGTINDDGNTYTLSSSLNIAEATPTSTETITEDNVPNTFEPKSKVTVVSSSADQLANQQEIFQDQLNTNSVLQLATTTNAVTSSQPLFVIRSPASTSSTAAEIPTADTSSNVLSSLIKYNPTTLTTLNSQVAPLGSSQNPIRIIQQGNQYTSTQQLNPDQLSQIMQVVQQQQAVRQAKQMGGTSVIYNPETQTKIVYRVINPADLHTKSTVNNESTVKTVQIGASGKTYAGKKRGRKRKIDIMRREEDEDGPELSRKEKEDKKKNRPKTRSGRVSKPPRHMIKDYKQIHLVDWNEEYDDSDGGYSDYRASGDEEGGRKRQNVEEEDDYEKLRPKRFACRGCDRRYIGRGGLERHWSHFPDHKTFSKIAEDVSDADRNEKDDLPTDAEASNDSFAHSFKIQDTKSLLNGNNDVNIDEKQTPATDLGGEVDDSVSKEQKEGHLKGQSEGRQTPVDTRTNNTNTGRKPWGRNSRRFKLMDLLERCSDEVVLDVALPRLAKICSVWNFLLSKARAEKAAFEESQRELDEDNDDEEEEDDLPPVKLSFSDVYDQYEPLRIKMKQVCNECKMGNTESSEDGGNIEKTSVTLSIPSTETADPVSLQNQESSDKKVEGSVEPLVFEFISLESANSLGQQCGVYKMLTELPEHLTNLPGDPLPMHTTKSKPVQDRLVSPAAGSVRKAKPKLYPGAVSVIPPMELVRKPSILGKRVSEPLNEEEIRAQMYAKRPPTSRLKLWIKDEQDRGDVEEEELSYCVRGERTKEKTTGLTKSVRNRDVNSALTPSSQEQSLQGETLAGPCSNSQSKDTTPDVQVQASWSKLTLQTNREGMICASDAADFKPAEKVTAKVGSPLVLSDRDKIVGKSEVCVAKDNHETQKKTRMLMESSNKDNDSETKSSHTDGLNSNYLAFKVFELPETTTSTSSGKFSAKVEEPKLIYDSTIKKECETIMASVKNEPLVNTVNKSEMETHENSTTTKPLVALTKDNTVVAANEMENVQNVLAGSGVTLPEITAANGETSDNSVTYKIVLPDSEEGRARTGETSQTTSGFQDMEIVDGGVSVPGVVMPASRVITSNIGAFISDSQSGEKIQGTQLPTVQLPFLSETVISQSKEHIAGSEVVFLEPSNSTSTVGYQFTDQDLGGSNSSSHKEVVTSEVTEGQGQQMENVQVLQGLQVIQTEDGIVLVKNPDGTFQIHSPHDQPIPLATVQALINLTPP